MNTCLITCDELAQLADAIALLDWIKNRLPDEFPEKAEAAVKAHLCHELISTILGNDAASVYSPADAEEKTAA